jgi:hypothetical protein
LSFLFERLFVATNLPEMWEPRPLFFAEHGSVTIRVQDHGACARVLAGLRGNFKRCAYKQ